MQAVQETKTIAFLQNSLSKRNCTCYLQGDMSLKWLLDCVFVLAFVLHTGVKLDRCACLIVYWTRRIFSTVQKLLSWLISQPGITLVILHAQIMLKSEEMVSAPSPPRFYSSYYSAVSAFRTPAYFSPLRRNVFADIHCHAVKLRDCHNHSFVLCSVQHCDLCYTYSNISVSHPTHTHTRTGDRGTLLPINV